MLSDPAEKNIARLMVRRHLRDWTKSEIISEELLVAMFIRTMKRNPDATMREVAFTIDLEIRELIEIVLGVPSEASSDEVSDLDPDHLGLTP